MKTRDRAEAPQSVTLPIAPMLDMTFQLLALFILTFRPAPMEGQITMNLPVTREDWPGPQSGAQPLMPSSTITVSITDAKGGVGSITLKVGNLAAETVPDAKDGVLAELRRRLEGLRDQDVESPTVMIEGTSGLTYGALISVVNACREANFSVGFAKPLS